MRHGRLRLPLEDDPGTLLQRLPGLLLPRRPRRHRLDARLHPARQGTAKGRARRQTRAPLGRLPGTRHRTGLRFPLVSLSAYRARRPELESSTNPFAVVTLAHLSAQETAGRDRYQAKLSLIRRLYRRGFARQDILELFRFIDWVLTLPEGLEDQLWTEVQQFDEERRMRYVSSFERIAQKKGMERGMEKGIGQGQARLLRLQLQQRFGLIPPEIAARIEDGRPEQLERWALRILNAVSLDDVFRTDDAH